MVVGTVHCIILTMVSVIPIMVMADIMVESMGMIITHRKIIIAQEEQLLLRVEHMRQGMNPREELLAPLVQKVQQQNLRDRHVGVMPEATVLQEMTTTGQLTADEIINRMPTNIQPPEQEEVVLTKEMSRENRFKEENLVLNKNV